MRLLRVPLALALLATGIVSGPTPARAVETQPLVAFEGHGWGHGVGMSQYGARAMAGAGHEAEEIVEHYFTGASVTSLASATSGWLSSDGSPLWVHILSRSAGSPMTIASAGGTLEFCQQEPAWVGTLKLGRNDPSYVPYNQLLEQALSDAGFDPGTIDGVFDPSTEAAVRSYQEANALGVDGLVGPQTKNSLWDFDGSDRCVIKSPLGSAAKTLTPSGDGTQCLLQGQSVAGDCFGSVRDLTTTKRAVLPQRSVRDGSPIELARGTLRIRPDRSGGTGALEGVHAVVEIGVDDYTAGIDEMPFSWPDEALQAQAIASRSYGVATAENRGSEPGFSGSTKDSCWCHLWSTTSSQVYAGFYAETHYGGEWLKAANATAGQVLSHPADSLVTAFFSSSNGGASEANEDAWGSKPVAYLRSVDDEWSLTPLNPYANWSYTFSAESVAGKIGLEELTGVAVVETNQSGSARTVRFVGLIGGVSSTIEKTGAWVRSAFGLRSNHYDVSWGDPSTPPAGSPEPPAEPTPSLSSGFGDISGSTFEDDIMWASETGVTKGCNPPENSRFCPDAKVTRGQMAAFLSRYIGLPAATEDYFDDDDGSTFEGDINRLAAAGITKGCGGTSFCPNQNVSREQMAAFLARAFDLTEMSHPGFSDVSESATFAADINRLATAGVTKGCNPPANSKYCPRDSVTRAQMTAFLHRIALR